MEKPLLESQLNPSNCIQTVSRYIQVGDKLVEHHYYTRFIAEETELWMFGVGLGDQAIMQQLGESFLEYCRKNDPALGNIMVSLGLTATAFYPYKGDFNLWWTWGDRPDWLKYYLNKTTVKPNLCLCPSKTVQKTIEENNLPSLYCPLGVGDRFQPLNLQRQGLGYSGSDAKSTLQKNLILTPFLKRPDFEWRGKSVTDEYFTLQKLNEWYNKKQIVFGMLNEHSYNLNILANRIYESYASGTPLIFPRHNGFEEVFGFPQPYAVDREGDAEKYVAGILADYEVVQAKFMEYGKITREKHNYRNRLETIFQRLREMHK
jgi:hypothetical protein